MTFVRTIGFPEKCGRLRAAALLLAICLTMLWACPGALAADEAAPLYQADAPIRFSASDNAVWIASGNEVFQYSYNELKSAADLGENPKGEARFQVDGLRFLCADNSLLYVCTEDGRVQALDEGGNPLGECALPVGLEPVKMAVSSGAVYLLGHDGESDGQRIYFCDPITEIAPEPLDATGWENANIADIAVSGSILYIYQEEGSQVFCVDAATYELISGPASAPPLDSIAVPIVNGDETDYVYLLSAGGEIRLMCISEGSAATVAAGFPEEITGLQTDKSLIYALSTDGKCLYGVALADTLTQSNTLTIVNPIAEMSMPHLRTAIELFNQRYPDVTVTTRVEEDPRVLATAVMAGTAGYDILCTQENNTMSCSPLMFKSGALVDLNQFDEITSLLPEYLDFFDALSLDGHLYGVPVEITPYLWEMNPELAEKLQVEIPSDGWTWDEFFQLADKVAEYNAQAEEPVYLLYDSDFLPYILLEYNLNTIDLSTGETDFTSPAFGEAMEKWRQAVNGNLICDDPDQSTLPDNALLFCSNFWGNYYSHLGNRRLILPPSFDENTRYPADYIAFEINSNSPNQEMAAYFLTCYLNPEAVLSMPIEYEGQRLKDISLYSWEDPEHRDGMAQASPENQEIWRKMLENSVSYVFIGDLDRDIGHTLLPQFYAGELSAEEFGAMCQRRANMVLGE